MKILLLLFVSISYLLANQDIIHKEYKHLSQQQKNNVIQAYSAGDSLIINGESYGKTIAAFILTETAGGHHRYLVGDNGQSAGWTQMGLIRTKELLAISPLYHEYLHYRDQDILYALQHNIHLNLHLCMLNFKLNMAKYDNIYSYAVKAHNGLNLKTGFYNQRYYKKFTTYLRVVELVLKEYNIK